MRSLRRYRANLRPSHRGRRGRGRQPLSLATHMGIEEERVYDCARSARLRQSPRGIEGARPSRGDVAALVEKVASDDFAAALTKFKEGISPNLEEEQKELLPQLRRTTAEAPPEPVSRRRFAAALLCVLWFVVMQRSWRSRTIRTWHRCDGASPCVVPGEDP